MRPPLENCFDLPTTVIPGKRIISHWKPTADELIILLEGGSVQIDIAGNAQPPMACNAVADATPP